MLVEFRVENFRSFRDEMVLSLVASHDNTLEQNCISVGKLRLLKAAAIYGPNASGKSNLVEALSTMRQLVLNSATSKPGTILPVKSFLLDEKSASQPSSFEITFFYEKIRYQYGFSATPQRIEREWLTSYPKGPARMLFERSWNKSSQTLEWKYGPSFQGERKKLESRTRDNVLFLSVGAQWDHEQLMTVYNWFQNKLRVMEANATWRPLTAWALLAEEEGVVSGRSMHDFVASFLKSADLGVSTIRVQREKLDESLMPDHLGSEFVEKMREHYKKEPEVKVEVFHCTDVNGKDVPFPLEEESDGTKRYLQLAVPWFQAVTDGITVVIDELERSLHPELTSFLIKVFQDTEISKKGAQLIFSSHATTLLNRELFRRDQIWFTEKDKTAATQLYSMSDYKERKPRKGEAMQKGYLAGRYGAIPILEAFSIPNG